MIYLQLNNIPLSDTGGWIVFLILYSLHLRHNDSFDILSGWEKNYDNNIMFEDNRAPLFNVNNMHICINIGRLYCIIIFYCCHYVRRTHCAEPQ